MTAISTITGYTSSGASTTSNASAQLDANMNTFMKLLVAQLQYQDPLDPVDTAEFTNQLVQYSSVEQEIQTNSKLDKLIASNTNNLAAQAVSYIGKVTQVYGDVMPLEDGKAMATYTLDTNVASSTIKVVDMNGKTVYTAEAGTTAGTHEFIWDGKDNLGNQLEDGAYQIIVATSAAQGSEKANVTTTVFGKVTGIANDENEVFIGLGNSVTATLGDILTVRDGGYLEDKFAGLTPASKDA